LLLEADILAKLTIHDDRETLVFHPKQIGDGHLDLVELNIS
jgi:hypothetical protein